jgi:hypothetical protein
MTPSTRVKKSQERAIDVTIRGRCIIRERKRTFFVFVAATSTRARNHTALDIGPSFALCVRPCVCLCAFLNSSRKETEKEGLVVGCIFYMSLLMWTQLSVGRNVTQHAAHKGE